MSLSYNDEIGKFVFDERMKGMTYQSIADELGVVVSTVYGWFHKYSSNILKEEVDKVTNDVININNNNNNNIVDIELLSNEELHIYSVGDWHIGSPECNYDLIADWIKRFEEDNNQKVIVGLGDYLEIGSKSIGNSSFRQQLNVNDQMNTFVNYLKPFKKHIIGMVTGNHSYNRLVKDYDFNIDNEIANKLGVNCYNRRIENLAINNENYSIYYKHGKGSVSKDELALSKLIKDNAGVETDLILNGHTHHSIWGSKVVTTNDNEFKRRYYAYCGSMLDFNNSYGDVMGLNVLLPSYLMVRVNGDLVTSIDLYNSDEVL